MMENQRRVRQTRPTIRLRPRHLRPTTINIPDPNRARSPIERIEHFFVFIFYLFGFKLYMSQFKVLLN